MRARWDLKTYVSELWIVIAGPLFPSLHCHCFSQRLLEYRERGQGTEMLLWVKGISHHMAGVI